MQNGAHVLSTDPARLQLDWVTRELQGSYWAASIQRQTVDRCVVGAWCFGAYRQTPGAQEEQVGFGRLITDWATFAYVCDVIVSAGSRGQGLGKWLVETMVSHPDLQGLRLWLLGTADAHELYRRFGFTETPPGRFMARRG